MWHFQPFCNLNAAFLKESTMQSLITNTEKRRMKDCMQFEWRKERNSKELVLFICCCVLFWKITWKVDRMLWKVYGMVAGNGDRIEHSCEHANLSEYASGGDAGLAAQCTHTVSTAHLHDIDGIPLAIPLTCTTDFPLTLWNNLSPKCMNCFHTRRRFCVADKQPKRKEATKMNKIQWYNIHKSDAICTIHSAKCLSKPSSLSFCLLFRLSFT